MLAPVILFVTSLATLAVAQSTTAPTGPGIGNQTIVPDSVPLSERNSWCLQQQNSCTSLCPGGQWANNTCVATTLVYSCSCADGSVPDLAIYLNTLPYQICEAYIGQCVQANATDPNAQNICRSTNTCGTLDPTKVTFTTTASTSSATQSTSGGNSSNVASTTGGSPSSPTTSNTPTTTPSAGMAVAPVSSTLMGISSFVVALVLTGFGIVL